MATDMSKKCILPKVLMVDDRSENLLALELLLEDFEAELVKANTGDEALSLLLDQEFALVLLDVQMPGMDGYEMAELMRQSERTKHVPIIFVTAINMTDQHVFKGYEAGAVDYLFKPIVPEILRSKVAVFVDLYRQRAIIQEQLEEINTLRGILPICANCKKIRNDDGFWEEVDIYIDNHSMAEFSHGICAECAKKLYPDYAPDIEDDSTQAT